MHRRRCASSSPPSRPPRTGSTENCARRAPGYTDALPINRADLAANLGLFSGTLLMGVRALGVPVVDEDSRALMHLWKYVGRLIEVDEDWLFRRGNGATPVQLRDPAGAGRGHRRRSRIDHRPGERTKGPALQEIPRGVGKPCASATPEHASRFSGVRGMGDLGQPLTLPWAIGTAWVRNTVNYRVIGRTPWACGISNSWGSGRADGPATVTSVTTRGGRCADHR
jgi:hypothetical protein